MKRSLILSTAFVAALSFVSATASAAIIFQDDFTKSNQALLGTTPNTGGNWTITGTSVVNPLQITGNQVPMANTGQDAYAAFAPSVPNAAGFPIRTSADITLSAVGTGDYFLHLSDPAGTTSNFFQRLGATNAGAAAGTYFLTLAVTAGGGATTTAGTTPLSLGTTYHVDVDWNFVSGALNDTFTVSVNGASYLTKAWDSTTSAEPLNVSAINLRQGTAGSAATLTVDNLKVEQIPEPATMTLLALAGMLARGETPPVLRV